MTFKLKKAFIFPNTSKKNCINENEENFYVHIFSDICVLKKLF